MLERRFRLCLTGGGTAGHVTPHFALLPQIRARGWEVYYVGSAGLEKPLVEAAGIPFRTIKTGKLRRYFSVENFLDVFRVVIGTLQAAGIMLRERPDAVFSKGGFVSVPVAVAAWLLRIPVVSHESDLTPGLATRIIARFARQLVYTFPETGRYLPQGAEQTGTPVRPELLEGDKARGAVLCGFDPAAALPTLLVMGGSQGAQRLNEALLAALPVLTQTWRIVHLTGKGKAIDFRHERYKAFEFVSDEMKDLLALADVVVSRAGANSIFELVAVGKPMLLVPLEQGSRGDQVVNAESFERSGWAHVLREKDLTTASFLAQVARLAAEADRVRDQQKSFAGRDAARKILAIIERVGGARTRA